MVKLASARESKLYGPWLARKKWEYINAGLYVFATILLVCGFVAQLSYISAKSGLIVLVISLILITIVNAHDLFAHLAGIDYRLPLLGFDLQLGFVEFGAPLVQALGSILVLLAILFVFIQAEKRRGYFRLEKHALNMLIAGPVLWLLGSIYNACQIYERADGHVQILQQSVHIPFLMGSLLFLVGSILNKNYHSGLIHHGLELLGKSWVALGIIGSLLFLIGGLMNLVKVFKMQQMDGIRLEKLRNGAQERLVMEREGQVPLILEEQIRRKRQIEEVRPPSAPVPKPTPTPATPYKDVLVGQS
ncbi:polypyrimidine tract-binding-like protein [Thalictrum thalictroides]|uniref:Polypyrimidine tract-binding-like protein n=1 Tax=Thalictrum thalictroides TaxID=46969 RepID=A0A7J6W5Y1_THATH|nr:polypyrimidine tract-binding-like protein [Thalictrum thalictroides]